MIHLTILPSKCFSFVLIDQSKLYYVNFDNYHHKSVFWVWADTYIQMHVLIRAEYCYQMSCLLLANTTIVLHWGNGKDSKSCVMYCKGWKSIEIPFVSEYC